MSVVTDIILFTEMHDDEAVERLNQWCEANDPRGQRFERLDTDPAGGYKAFTSVVWAMSANHFRHEELAAVLPSFGWRYPHHVVLVVNDEHDECARVYRAAPEPGPRYVIADERDALPADEHHFDVSCDDRPDCLIPAHHAMEDMQ